MTISEVYVRCNGGAEIRWDKAALKERWIILFCMAKGMKTISCGQDFYA
jgi:hypothetical protein